MIDTVVNTKDVKNAEVVILSAPYEGGVSFMGGTALAPAKILEALNNNLELFDINLKTEPAKNIKTAHVEVAGLEKLSPEEMIKKIQSTYKEALDQNKFTIMLGGEHTVSIGSLSAIAEKDNPKDITIFQIDAHQDLRDDSSDYSDHPRKFGHASAMRRAYELGFPIVQAGIRVFSKYEYDFWQENKDNIQVFPWTRDSKIPEISEIIKSIKTEKVYLSLDVDGIDPSFMPGTGTPVQGGLDWNYTLNLLEKLFEEKNVIGADIVEASPILGSVLTEYGAAQLCYSIITNKFRKKS